MQETYDLPGTTSVIDKKTWLFVSNNQFKIDYDINMRFQKKAAARPNVANGILQPGRNCWKIETSSRTSVIIDSEDYFKAFYQACKNAREQIIILGWDFDRKERLHRDEKDRELPDELGTFLSSLVRRNSKLNIYLLSWDFNLIYAAERELLPALRLRLQAPARFHFRLDGQHPKGASHHQKIVVIDDRIAFVGGIDLSRWRWDSNAHKADDPRRIDPNGKPYPPFHDLMMLVEGDAARRLGDLARKRWRCAHGWRIKPVKNQQADPWPDLVKPGIKQQSIAIARTEPAFKGQQAVNEIRQLYLDAITAASHSIYTENQYFTASCLANALCESLSNEEGPQVVLVLPLKTGGWLEQVTMDVLRARLLKRLRRADKWGRLQVYYPYQPGLDKDNCISVHAKLMIVDDCLLRIGSANTSNRSMGLDTECDLAMEATQEETAARNFIRHVHHRLLAEHLNVSAKEIDRCHAKTGGMIETIEKLRTDNRSLRILDTPVPEEVNELVPDSAVIDPEEPFSPDYFITQYIPKDQRPAGRKRLLLFGVVILVLFALAGIWQFSEFRQWLSPENLAQQLSSLSGPGHFDSLVIFLLLLFASLLMVPITLLAVVAGILFDSLSAFIYIFGAAISASALGFISGRLLGKGLIKQFGLQRIEKLSKRLAERGTVAVSLLRLVPIAPFAVFNFVAGASHLRFRQFLLGSIIGLAPGLGGITFFSNTLWAAITNPSWQTMTLAILTGGLLLFIASLIKRWLRTS